jgi:cellulose synthase/poly-beta-1,6-N-acetylglucosamine synthase-like glycosyltransferase
MMFVFWIACFVVFYHIVLYGLILKILIKSTKIDQLPIMEFFPTATMICPAYNEEEKIAEKIESFLKVDYPKDKINLIFISDDSKDDTNTIVRNYEKKYDNIKLVVQKPRAGKPSAQNLVEPTIKSEIVLLSDASSILKKDSLRKLIRHFQNSKIGLVASKLIYVEKEKGISSGEGLYWKYETWLRYLESEFHSISVSSGALFALRRELFTQIHPASPDDFERTLIVMENGFQAYYETESLVTEFLENKNTDEIQRKIRVISREWFALFRHAKLLNPFVFQLNYLIPCLHDSVNYYYNLP